MAELKEYVWVIPIVAGILGFISILAPAVSMNLVGMLTANFWFWDLYIYSFSGGPILSGAEFITEPTVMVTNFITTGILAIGGILLLVIGIRSKKRWVLSKMKMPLIVIGALFIISELLWLILVPLFFPMAYYWDFVLGAFPYTFWSWNMGFMSYPLHSVGFGVIGGFLAAGISFGAAGAAHYYSKERKVKMPEKKEVVPTTKEPTPSETPELKFCPECGAEIEDPNIKFCGKCGFEFKNPELAPL